MYKFLLMIVFILQFLNAQNITFSEKKYIYAVDNEFTKSGKLLIDTQKVVLQYLNSEKKVIYTKDLIQIIDNGIIENFTHEENIQYKLFFTLVIAIYNNDLQQVKENFVVKQDQKETTLLPNEQIASVIEKISFEKNEKRLKQLIIYFKNQDRITIEQTN